MDRLTDFLPLPLLLKTEQVTEDRKQQTKTPNKKKRHSLTNEHESNVPIDSDSSSTWDDNERRSGDDRRALEKKRGKWLDSRAEKDRRELSKALSVKI